MLGCLIPDDLQPKLFTYKTQRHCHPALHNLHRGIQGYRCAPYVGCLFAAGELQHVLPFADRRSLIALIPLYRCTQPFADYTYRHHSHA
ncbi:hypothetical protein D3C75_1201520 [compost metagenome]